MPSPDLFVAIEQVSADKQASQRSMGLTVRPCLICLPPTPINTQRPATTSIATHIPHPSIPLHRSRNKQGSANLLASSPMASSTFSFLLAACRWRHYLPSGCAAPSSPSRSVRTPAPPNYPSSPTSPSPRCQSSQRALRIFRTTLRSLQPRPLPSTARSRSRDLSPSASLRRLVATVLSMMSSLPTLRPAQFTRPANKSK